VVLLATVAVTAPAAAASPAGKADRALDRALRRLVNMPAGPPGAAVMVQRGGRARFHRAGVAEVRSRRRLRSRQHMRIASVSKAFSGAVALALVDRGFLSLDDTIGKRLPGFPAAWSAVTLRQLLNHTSGLPDYTKDPGFLAFLNANPHAYLAPDQILPFVEDEPLQFPPGSAYAYSNSDNITVGLMAQAATGGSYEGELSVDVFEPLGLRRTSMPAGFRLPRPFIHGYDVQPPTPPQDVSTVLSVATVWASGGIVSTPRDLNRFIRGYVGGKLFGRRTRRRQLRFVAGSSDPPGPGTNAAGLAVFRYRTRCGTVYGHTGSFPGYTQFAAASRSGRRSATVSVNTQLNPDAGDPAVFRALRRVDELAVCSALARRSSRAR
jgi:D-alanyl-D-alanine carboxypeptidase